MFPIDGMPVPAQWIATFIPLTHCVELIHRIVLQGASLIDMPRQVFSRLGFLVFFLTVAARRFRKRLD